MALKTLEQAITVLSLSISSVLALAFSYTFAATFTLAAARVLTIAVGLAALAGFLEAIVNQAQRPCESLNMHKGVVA
ncbi:uncharacterized protein BDZ83DRAFT_135708 [Colletotrichum acutatum]|uniref:Uncharacterized protein n=1 Tax=Glomerella acutata TaxID=27357 RepID=A0AAD8UDA8_GLOAC|nr:uncharacterized protein BDZ83DRAFT_135708 [Colletotrichum acutatum]KAK1709744.1 hypothetical protein BDZ83DRAFT_135708 [Colletotrichum acutatum]